MVRQLIYDFRMWRALEATGRSGSDDGFDARAIELVPSPQVVEREPDDDGEAVEPHSERVWLIQCKREKAIGPSKIVKYLEVIPLESIEGLYGLVFAAACDFSKATRDACRAWCRHQGVQEFHIWGRGEIEDELFQPKNDNLLFAYFGISLQIRRQAAGTRIRRAITLKRRIRKIQESATWPGAPIILRDPTDDRYPVFDQAGWERGDYLWRPAWSCGAGIHGLKVIVRSTTATTIPRRTTGTSRQALTPSSPERPRACGLRPRRSGNRMTSYMHGQACRSDTRCTSASSAKFPMARSSRSTKSPTTSATTLWSSRRFARARVAASNRPSSRGSLFNSSLPDLFAGEVD